MPRRLIGADGLSAAAHNRESTEIARAATTTTTARPKRHALCKAALRLALLLKMAGHLLLGGGPNATRIRCCSMLASVGLACLKHANVLADMDRTLLLNDFFHIVLEPH